MKRNNPSRPSVPPKKWSSRERELFGPQRTGTAGLPDPQVLIRSLAMSAVEIIHGTRPLDKIGAWITGEVAAELSRRRTLQHQRDTIAKDTRRIPHALGSTTTTQPADGVVEGVAMVHSRVRSRAVAVRLESLDNRWRATALSVL